MGAVAVNEMDVCICNIIDDEDFNKKPYPIACLLKTTSPLKRGLIKQKQV